jgi:hypothetical protein
VSQDYETLDLRPYQLMLIVSRAAAGCSGFGSARLDEVVRRIRAVPYAPVRLRANVSSIYRFQNPGHDEDTSGGAQVNVKRDLDILQRLGLNPGATMPAMDLFDLLLANIPTSAGIAGFDPEATGSWADSAGFSAASYVKGVTQGLSTVFTLRDQDEMARVKRESADAVYEAEQLFIRPHHLMCMTCFYGSHSGDDFAPIAPDNLYEAIVAMQRNPNVPVTLVQGPCMICPPCDYYDPDENLCYLHVGIGLRDEKKDLDALQLMGLDYGDTLPARALLARLYERIPSTRLVCGQKDGIERSASWRICDNPDGSERYASGRRAGIGVVTVLD